MAFRLPFVVLAIFSLLTGLATGLSRIGWDFNILVTSLSHGAIMVGGFLGTLISLEKIIPLKRKLLFIIPALSGTSVVLFFLALPLASFTLLVLASAALSGVFVHYLLKERSLTYMLMLGGGLCWLTGNVMLISEKFYPAAFPWWVGFVVFIITAERLEMTKFLPVTEATKKLLVSLLVMYTFGVIIGFHSAGHWVGGSALIGTSLWLMKYDIVGISIRKQGLQKFMGTALLSGYVSMLMTGVFMLSFNDHILGYDATLHTFFLGFVFSMIFAHGPVILPGVLGISVRPWHYMFYLWLFLLHGSWVTRIIADVVMDFELRKTSALISTVSILGYFATIATITAKSKLRHAKVL